VQRNEDSFIKLITPLLQFFIVLFYRILVCAALKRGRDGGLVLTILKHTMQSCASEGLSFYEEISSSPQFILYTILSTFIKLSLKNPFISEESLYRIMNLLADPNLMYTNSAAFIFEII